MPGSADNGQVFELLILFFLLPTVIYISRLRIHAIPLLWILMSYCLWVLWREGHLSLVRPEFEGLVRRLPSILTLFAAFVIVITALVYRYAPRDFFGFFRKQPALWFLVMVLYPLLSVYPQGIIYRVFFFERYRALFPSAWLMVLMSALAFTYVHVIFRNWLAVGLTVLGGLLFAMRYAETGSLFVSSFEHALYGCWLFTVGLGRSFFYRAQWKEDLPRIP
jgi:uncharacterized protein